MTVPCDVPYGRKEIAHLEAHILARTPREFIPFRDEEVGIGAIFYTKRGVSNSSVTWYWSKIRKALIKCGLIGSTWDAWVMFARVKPTAIDPRIEISISSEEQ